MHEGSDLKEALTVDRKCHRGISADVHFELKAGKIKQRQKIDMLLLDSKYI